MIQDLRGESWGSSTFKFHSQNEKKKKKHPAMEMEKHCKGGQMRNKRGWVPETKWGFKHDSYKGISSNNSTRIDSNMNRLFELRVDKFVFRSQ